MQTPGVCSFTKGGGYKPTGSPPARPSELATELRHCLLSEPGCIDCKGSEKINPTEEPYMGEEQAHTYWQNPSDAFKALSKQRSLYKSIVLPQALGLL